MFSFGLIHDVDCFVEIVRPLFDESVLESSLYCVSVHLDGQRNSIVHGYGQRLGSAHLAQTGCEDDSSFETPAKMLPSGGCKSLVGSLEDSLCSYEGPGASRLPGSSVNYQVLRILGHLRVQHVVEHPQRSLDLPVLAMKGCTSNDGWAPLVLQSSNGLTSPALSQLTSLPSLTVSFPAIRTLSTMPSPYVYPIHL